MTDLLQQDPLKPELTVHICSRTARSSSTARACTTVPLEAAGSALAMLLAKNGRVRPKQGPNLGRSIRKKITDAAELATELE